MVNHIRKLSSGEQVSYNDLPTSEWQALAEALDEWEWLVYKRQRNPDAEERAAWDAYYYRQHRLGYPE